MTAPGPRPPTRLIDRETRLAPGAPVRGWRGRLADWCLRRTGWRVMGALPTIDKFMLIVAPHTSNWDLPVGLMAGFGCRILSRWPYGFMMKASMFRGPLGPVMRRIGGLPVNRSEPEAIVDQMAGEFLRRERFFLAVTPEGTRRRRPHWKTGFYRIALTAAVPVVPVYFDYRRREVGIGHPVRLSGDPDGDLAVFRDFYRGVTARRPHEAGDIRFREGAGASGIFERP